MLIELPNGKWINPKSVQSIFAGPDSVCVILSTWNQLGNHNEVIEGADLTTLVEAVNAGCYHADHR